MLRISWKNYLAGARLVLMLPVGRRDFHGSPFAAVDQMLDGVVLAFFLAYLGVDPPRAFEAYGLTFALSAYLLLGLACYVIARVRNRDRSLPALATIVFGAALWVLALGLVIVAVEGRGLVQLSPAVWGWLKIGACFWVMAISVRCVRVMYGIRHVETVRPAATLLFAVSASFVLLPVESMWYTRETSQPGTAASRIDVEATYYRQPSLVAKVVDEMVPGRAGTADLFFVGFAGWATEGVFLNEIRSAAGLFKDRYEAGGRSILMANSLRTARELPLANGTNLREVLRAIGRKMDRDEDVLFLFLTSHGSPGRLAAHFPGFNFNDIAPDALRDMLDKSGIRWRVLVVSSCYSGSFVEALRDDHTLVITAAAADRTSFGCGHDGPYTYFGEAYFGHALRQQRSFSAAFQIASDRISTREKLEFRTPSLPQIEVGSAIERKLLELERNLTAQK